MLWADCLGLAKHCPCILHCRSIIGVQLAAKQGTPEPGWPCMGPQTLTRAVSTVCWFGFIIRFNEIGKWSPIMAFGSTAGPVQTRDSIILPMAGWQGKTSHSIGYSGKAGISVVLAASACVYSERREFRLKNDAKIKSAGLVSYHLASIIVLESFPWLKKVQSYWAKWQCCRPTTLEGVCVCVCVCAHAVAFETGHL